MSLRVVNVMADEVAPFQERLRKLERSIQYPIADGQDHFHIDHGADYGAFFAALGEQAGFLFALDSTGSGGPEVVGTLAGVRRTVRVGDRELPAIYLADYKVAPSHRGRGVGAAMIWRSTRLLLEPEIRRCKLIYAAAMRGAKGDVMRSARGKNRIMRLARPFATLHVYFVDARALAELDAGGCPENPRGRGVDLSPHGDAELVDTSGRKDLRLASGKPWPLDHLPLGPGRWGASLASYLRRGGALSASRERGAQCCFALDRRLVEHVAWLSSRGIAPGAACTVHALRIPPASGAFDWVHLATSEI